MFVLLFSYEGGNSMKELLTSKGVILFLLFMVGISHIQSEQIKLDSANDNNSIIINQWLK